jgi:hypothetical protein
MYRCFQFMSGAVLRVNAWVSAISAFSFKAPAR